MLKRKIVVNIDLRKAVIEFIKYGRFLKLEIQEHDVFANGGNVSVYQRPTGMKMITNDDLAWMGNGSVVYDAAQEVPTKLKQTLAEDKNVVEAILATNKDYEMNEKPSKTGFFNKFF